MKNIKRNSLIILIITISILIYLLHDNYLIIYNILKKANLLWIILALFIYSIYFLLDNFVLYKIVKEFKKEITFKFIIKLGIITKFFNGITPLATGGQPMQVYELKKKGISITNGTNIVIQNYIIFQIALVLLGVSAIIINKLFQLFSYLPLLFEMTIIGFIINFVILILLLLIGFSKNFNKNILSKIINLLYKVKIIKNKEKQINKWQLICEDYYKNTQVLLKHKEVLISSIFLQLISLILSYSIPYIIAISLNSVENLSLLKSIIAGCYIFIMGCYIPIPGASGGMEYAFLGFIGFFINEPNLSAILIIWRFITYYLPTLIGAIVFNISFGNRKNNNSLQSL